MNIPAHSEAAERNKTPILEVLKTLLAAQGAALEIASGTGQHVTWFAQHLSGWTWQPSDAHTDFFQGIEARVAMNSLSNVRTPLLLDVLESHWLPAQHTFDLIYCANMLHISPWTTCAALMQGSARHLAPGGRLVTYGPYLEQDVATSAGNCLFDKSLRAQNPDWGIRYLHQVTHEAAQAGLQLSERHAMPANNLLLVWTH
jgi:SAM-dependent methyltransferase